MKKLSLFLALTLFAVFAFGQTTKAPVKTTVKIQGAMVCCAKSAPQQFAMLASNNKFVMSHGTPKPFHFQSSIGKPVTYQTPDGKEATAFELKAKSPTNNYLLVIHEYWGLNDYIKKESEMLYNV